MMTETMRSFARTLNEDEALATGLAERLNGVSGREQAVAETAGFAQANGFDLSEDEASRLINAVGAARNGELSDEDLEGVAGGASLHNFFVPDWFA
ncbi:hypothetical protein [Oceanibaculum indicum]|uniref:hypothetical protein n=1 Tax=Oceanibaculum indicum TaxID=526216 RepID=UPI0002E61126|nr:hypothetical protein [Oceanibaculum indicum]